MLALTLAALLAAPAGYAVRDLGTLGGPWAAPLAMSADGHVAGMAQVQAYGDVHAFVEHNGALLDLFPAVEHSRAFGVNSLGDAVGATYDVAGTPYPHAFLWHAGVAIDLGTFGGVYSHAFAVNDAGTIVGGNGHALVIHGGSAKNLGTLGGRWSLATALSQGGLVAGTSFLAGDADYHAFFFDGRSVADIDTFGGDSYATAVNDAREVVGWYVPAWARGARGARPKYYRAFLWDALGMHDLGRLHGADVVSEATAVNGAGQVVGWSGSLDSERKPRAWLWENGAMHDLTALIDDKNYVIRYASAIDDAGEIAAVCAVRVEVHACVLEPR